MKKIICVLLVALVSCSSGNSKNDIIGSWTLELDKSKPVNAGMSNVMSFYANDSLKIETFNQGKLFRSFAGIYKLDESNKEIITEANNIKTTLKIISLTENRLTLKNENLKMTTNFVRSK
jgi:hypothetical protein